MAIQYVGGQVGGRAGSTSTTNITYSLSGGLASTPAAGDLVIIAVVVASQGRTPACAVTSPATWINLTQVNANGTTYDTSMNLSRKFMGSTPDTTFTLPSTGNVADAQSYTVQVWRGVDATTPLDVAAVSTSGTATGRPNPAAITPTTTGAYVLIMGGGAAGTGASYTAPANYTTNFLTNTTVDTNDSMIGSGYRAWTSGTEDPAAYTGGTTNAVDSWAAFTVALRPANTNKVLTCNNGTYSLTGQSASVNRNRVLTASNGTYSQTGQDVSITKTKDYPLTALSGTYSFTGQSATLDTYGTVACLLMEDGFYLLQEDGGKLAIEPLQYIVYAANGSYTLTGQSSTINRNRILTASNGSYAVSGQSAVINKNRSLTSSFGSYSVTGQTATVLRSKKIVANNGSYSVTGQSSTINRNRVLTPTFGSYSLTGQTATILKSKVIQATRGTYTYTGQTATVLRSKQITASSGTYSYTGQSVTIKLGKTLVAQTGTYTLNGQPVDITIVSTKQTKYYFVT